MTLREQALGPDPPDTALSLNNLARLYNAQGRYEEAAPLLQRALKIVESVLRPAHSTMATLRANYAALLDTMKR